MTFSFMQHILLHYPPHPFPLYHMHTPLPLTARDPQIEGSSTYFFNLPPLQSPLHLSQRISQLDPAEQAPASQPPRALPQLLDDPHVSLPCPLNAKIFPAPPSTPAPQKHLPLSGYPPYPAPPRNFKGPHSKETP